MTSDFWGQRKSRLMGHEGLAVGCVRLNLILYIMGIISGDFIIVMMRFMGSCAFHFLNNYDNV